MEYNWNHIEKILHHAKRVYIYGPPGIGKTYAAQAMGNQRGIGTYSLTLTEETPAAELRGHYIPNEAGAFQWHDGPVIRAMKTGGTLILNEITHASPDAWSFLFPILENAATAKLTLPTGETVEASPDMFVVATDNQAPEDIPDALRDRFTVSLEITEPHPDAIAMLPENIRETALNSIVNSEGSERVSLRAWFEYVLLKEPLGPELASEAVFGRRNASGILEALAINTTSENLGNAADAS